MLRLPSSSCTVAWTLLLAALAIGGCNKEERALARARCGESVAPLVTDVALHAWGIDGFACLRLVAHDDSERRRVESSCALLERALVAVNYPARGAPALLPDWWALRMGDNVYFGEQEAPDGSWHALVYRQDVGHENVWYMCAGSD